MIPYASLAPEQNTSSVKFKQPLLPVVVGILILLEVLVPYRGWVVLLVTLGGVWAVSALWARSLSSGLRVIRETRFGWKQVGDTLLERITLINDGWAPAIWLELKDQSTLANRTVVTGISGNSSLRRHQQTTCNRRGLFTLGPTTLRSGDPFGIYEVEIHNPSTVSLMVMPPVVNLPGVRVSSGGRLGEGRPRQSSLVRSVSSSRVAEYSPGDNLNWIHWPTSARLDSLYVRYFDSMPAGDWWIVLDLDEQSQYGEGLDSTEEHAIIAAASLADRALRNRHPVGLAAIAGDKDRVLLPPRANASQRWEILLALTLAETGKASLGELLRGLSNAIRSASSLIVITPNASDEWVPDLLPFMRRGAVPTVLLLDPGSFGGPDHGGSAQLALNRAGIRLAVIEKGLWEPVERRSLPASARRLKTDPWVPLA